MKIRRYQHYKPPVGLPRHVALNCDYMSLRSEVAGRYGKRRHNAALQNRFIPSWWECPFCCDRIELAVLPVKRWAGLAAASVD